MKDRAHHGIRFMTGFSLVLALAASACVAGEVGDESEATVTAVQADRIDEGRYEQPGLADPSRAEAMALNDVPAEGAAVPCADAPRDGAHPEGPRHCPFGRGVVKLDQAPPPPKQPEPPPQPW